MHQAFLLAFVIGLTSAVQTRAEIVETNNYELRQKAADQYYWHGTVDFEKFELTSRALIKDFPNRSGGYENFMALINDLDQKQPQKALSLANEMAADKTPEKYRLWAKGCIKRLTSIGKPVRIQFIGTDGQEVDTAKMGGKVVLVDFWATTCSPCVRDLPQIKSLHKKYGEQGFEVIGISCDSSQQTDREKFSQFLQRKEIPWPQFYDGKQQTENRLAQEFGINGMPHLLLIDKKGNLRFDKLRLKDGLEAKINELLAE